MADLRGCEGCAPLGVQILSISCSFGENLAKSYVGAPSGEVAPLLGEILDPRLVYTSEMNENKQTSEAGVSLIIQQKKSVKRSKQNTLNRSQR